MLIRKATISDVEEAGKIYDLAREYMKAAGNPYQWNDVYPSARDVEEDIKDGSSYVCDDGGEIVAVFHFHIGSDATYEKIYEGGWEGTEPYGVIHRIAVKHHGRGIADFCFSECFKLFPNLRIDTHKDNIPMQKSLMKNGFVKKGTVYIKNGEERIAFQKIKQQ